ncbi:hypothetical protein Fmac_027098 [Flemingia macrophylla]|uniref:Uncharacterized protein n=1 Tax=Flemingia macrophylla TaxID=520843 RepID=A0ABD1LGT4_9FABA
MEAVGSRLSRASSRYGAPAVFSGPVRKWKKKWVHVTPSSLPNHSHSNNPTSSSRLLLRRWTPTTADDAAATVADDPPRRKFRYTPVCASFSLCFFFRFLKKYVLSVQFCGEKFRFLLMGCDVFGGSWGFGCGSWVRLECVCLFVCLWHELGFGAVGNMIAVLDEQKKMMTVKAEDEPATESDQSASRHTNVTREMQGKLNMNEMLEEAKNSNMGNLDLDLDFQSNNGENSQSTDDQLEKKYVVGGP